MPPIVARLLVETSTGNISPCGRSRAFRRSSTMPGPTVMRRSTGANETTSSRCLLVSMTMASPTVWPHCEVPPPRGSTGTPASVAISIVRATSAVPRGTTTPIGSIW